MIDASFYELSTKLNKQVNFILYNLYLYKAAEKVKKKKSSQNLSADSKERETTVY